MIWAVALWRGGRKKEDNHRGHSGRGGEEGGEEFLPRKAQKEAGAGHFECRWTHIAERTQRGFARRMGRATDGTAAVRPSDRRWSAKLCRIRRTCSAPQVQPAQFVLVSKQMSPSIRATSDKISSRKPIDGTDEACLNRSRRTYSASSKLSHSIPIGTR